MADIHDRKTTCLPAGGKPEIIVRKFLFGNGSMVYKTSFTIHNLPKPERPRERLKKLCLEALSAQELLALIIGRGIPQKSVMNIDQKLLVKYWA